MNDRIFLVREDNLELFMIFSDEYPIMDESGYLDAESRDMAITLDAKQFWWMRPRTVEEVKVIAKDEHAQ